MLYLRSAGDSLYLIFITIQTIIYQTYSKRANGSGYHLIQYGTDIREFPGDYLHFKDFSLAFPYKLFQINSSLTNHPTTKQ